MATPEDPSLDPEPPRLRQLRLLVTVLTATMILGLIIIISLIVITFTKNESRQAQSFPSELTIPEGQTTQAITTGDGWIGAVTTGSDGQQQFLIFDKATGALRQSIEIRQ